MPTSLLLNVVQAALLGAKDSVTPLVGTSQFLCLCRFSISVYPLQTNIRDLTVFVSIQPFYIQQL